MEHVRIDKGVKRGPKKLPKAQKRGPRPNLPRTADGRILSVIPPDLKPGEVLQRYLSEETTSQIASSYGISRKTLTQWLREVAKDEWRKVQIIRALDIKDKGNEQLEVADDALSLARAREMVKSAQWELQALDEDYRPKNFVTIENIGDLGDRLRRAKERVIEGESVVVHSSNEGDTGA